ncbi:MAG: 50S ribosomal protein L21 [Candidatus Krumholzibacteria bacterium]|nr:50S ribosomal protein L21 [Candidatus Krumholzibacteria bacterium]
MEKYAIVDVAGSQCRVMAKAVLRVPKLDAEVGSSVSFDKVLLLSDGKKVTIGQPYLDGKAIDGEVVRHGRDRKIVVFKKKKRKNYKRTRGHRQNYTEIIIKTLPK